MEREIPHGGEQSPVERRPIAQGVEELRSVLGDLARVALTSYSDVMSLTREIFNRRLIREPGMAQILSATAHLTATSIRWNMQMALR